MGEIVRVKLPTVDASGLRVGSEVLQAERLGGRCYRLICSPRQVEGVAAGDVIELDRGQQRGFRVVERSGNLCVWFLFQRPALDVTELHAAVTGLGGRCDCRTEHSLTFTIPIKAGFQAVAEVLDRAVETVPDSAWFYGNVYDPTDGKTPLYWWA